MVLYNIYDYYKKEKLFIFGGIMLKRMNKGKNSTGKYITNEEIEYIIKNMNMPQFTVLDFGKFIQENNKDLWDMLTNKYTNKYYSAYSYLSQRLIRYSKEKGSLLEVINSYKISLLQFVMCLTTLFNC